METIWKKKKKSNLSLWGKILDWNVQCLLAMVVLIRKGVDLTLKKVDLTLKEIDGWFSSSSRRKGSFCRQNALRNIITTLELVVRDPIMGCIKDAER